MSKLKNSSSSASVRTWQSYLGSESEWTVVYYNYHSRP